MDLVAIPTPADLFRYPTTPHVRKHGPRGYAEVASFKDWLRDEFSFRCAYCLSREGWEWGRSAFAVNRVVPPSVAPERKFDYSNLVYACRGCSSAKRDFLILDPRSAILADQVIIAADGTAVALTEEGRLFVETLRLNKPSLSATRKRLMALLARLAARFRCRSTS